MAFPSHSRPFAVAFIGNPNTGKSTLFGALVGARQRVGNYPGVTVEKKTGLMDHEGRRYELVDLPGLYSLAPRSPDEMIAVDVLLGRRVASRPPDAIVCILDACNLERHLYLVSQVLELGIPTVVALNMLDVAEDHGVAIDVERLRRQLGVPVVPMQANRAIGVPDLMATLARLVEGPPREAATPLPEVFEDEVSRLQTILADDADQYDGKPVPRYLVRRLLLDMGSYLQQRLLEAADGRVGCQMRAARDRLAQAGCEVPGIETKARYAWVHRVLDGVVERPCEYPATATDRIDRVVTHPVWGMALFVGVMVLVFQSVFTWAGPFMTWIEAGFDAVGELVRASMAPGALESLIVDGVIGGVGAVFVFLPQILILFLFIAVLEDCGYMARAAYLMDKMMVRVGLNGKAFIPMLASFACAVPGIMAARVIENERDRLTTILVAPLMTCSARLPIYVLLIGAFIPARTYFGAFSLQGLTLVGLYALGITAAVAAAWVFKRTILRGQAPPFMMELPSYKWPSLRTILFRVAERGWVFLHTAGTMILAVSILIWAALYFPHDAAAVEAPFRARRAELKSQVARLEPESPERERAAEELEKLERQIAGAYQRQSFLGRAGRLVEPVFVPLGWDWRISCAVIASFPAREVVVATLGVVFNLGEEIGADSDEGYGDLRAKLDKATWDGSDRKVFTVPVALSIMVFFALCAQCAATLAVIRRETNSWRWPAFTFAYMTALAYVGALATYQFGTWIGGWTG